MQTTTAKKKMRKRLRSLKYSLTEIEKIIGKLENDSGQLDFHYADHLLEACFDPDNSSVVPSVFRNGLFYCYISSLLGER